MNELKNIRKLSVREYNTKDGVKYTIFIRDGLRQKEIVTHTFFEKGSTKIEPLYLYNIKDVVKVLYNPIGVIKHEMLSGILLKSRVLASASLLRRVIKTNTYTYDEFREKYMEYFV